MIIAENTNNYDELELMRKNIAIINNEKILLNHSIHDLIEIMRINNYIENSTNYILILNYGNKEAIKFFKKINNYHGQVKHFDKYNWIIECEYKKSFKLDPKKVLFLREEKKETKEKIKIIRYYYTRRQKREYQEHLGIYTTNGYNFEDYYFKIELIDYKNNFNFEYAFNENNIKNSTFKTATRNSTNVLDKIGKFKKYFKTCLPC